MKILIIGGVAGGASTATRLRRQDEKAQIILLERGEFVSYANCGLPYYIGDTITERDRLFVQTSEGFKSRFNIDVRTKSEVTAINLKAKEITINDLNKGQQYTESYNKLVIATGAEPIKPQIPGIENNRIFSLRNVPDTDRIKEYIQNNNIATAAVIGGGFIGLEMVENLHQIGIDVCIIERANQVMNPIDFSMAAQVHQHLKSKGVGLLLSENVTAFEHHSKGINILLESRKTVYADMVILSIGVLPEVMLAKECGLELGSLRGIKVDQYMQTSDKDVYALGDAVEVFNPVINKHAFAPLAGPANKQGRIVADNIVEGNKHSYTGSIGTSIAKVFDLTVAATGASSKLLDRENIAHISSYTHSNSHAGYYPNSLPLSIKIDFSPTNGKLLGAQITGFGGVDKRIDLIAQIIKNGGSIFDLQMIEHAYAPPYSSAKDPVNMAGFVAENILTQKVNSIQWDELKKLDTQDLLIIDVRTKAEHEMGCIEGSINIPLDDIRHQLCNISIDKRVLLYCAVGQRGYLASRILLQSGYNQVYNLSGGYKTYLTATDKQGSDKPYPSRKEDIELEKSAENNVNILHIDACGLQCPGPIMQLKKNYDLLNEGDRLEIKVTDQAFSEDLKGWCRMMGATLVGIESKNGIIAATVEKGSENKTSHRDTIKLTDNKTLIVFSNDLDRVLASFVIANGAAASGKKVSMFFTFWGLNVLKKQNKPKVSKDFFSKMFAFMLPSSSKDLPLSQMNMGGMGSKMMRYIMQKKNVDSLESLIQQAIDNNIEMIACSMSMDVMGISKEELIDQVTIGGVAAYLDRADNANVNLFI
ncbi:MAG: hypothetical protein RL662_862 [Bacteroidota bacterium]|jgi:NADPH-dependent 2,4-dienoyl-CoA reductase/sulfur reductase-like enzyme/peroxiredoxin family protein/rhodanese-related sulfurtransferase/TusA-related sulfurtransferase